MKIYPEIICEKTSSGAERLIYEYFRLCDLPGYLAFHSLLLPRHPRKYVGETDFLILSKKGILIIEIKGGVIETKRGNWTVATEAGTTKDLPESPFSQAIGNMYAVRNDMNNAGLPFTYRKHLLGCGVIFPNCIFECKGLDIEQKIIMDARDLKRENPLSSFIRQLEKFWEAKLETSRSNLNAQDMYRIRDWLRPRYHSVPSLRAEHLILEQRMVTLLDEQMDFLESARSKQRVICSGGAGTGKTLVGLEFTRQKQQEGMKAYFIIPNPILATYIKNRGYVQPWFLTLDQLKSRPDNSADWLVIDESQDIMSFEGFSEIDRVLSRGIEGGNWLLLCDQQNQTGIDGNFDSEFSEYLSILAETEIILPRNIRNTIQIIDNTQSLTGKNIGKRGTGRGRKIDYIDYRDIQDAALKVKNIIDDLLRKDLETRDILILGKSKACETELFQEMKRQGVKCIELNSENINQYPFYQPAYSTIRNCKGLESYVVITDLSDFEPDEFDNNELYVALTRPVSMLYLLYQRGMKNRIGKIQMKNLKKKGKTANGSNTKTQ